MRIDILTLFPDMFKVFDESILGRGKEKGLYSIHIANIRDFLEDLEDKPKYLIPKEGGEGFVLLGQKILDNLK